MDTTKLERFAQYARRTLLQIVGNKLKLVLAEGSAARREAPTAIKELEKAIKASSEAQVTEQVAYTWFNRFCALRFLDVKRYHKVLVTSPAEGQFQPEILAEAKAGVFDESLIKDESQRVKIQGLLRGSVPSLDPQGEAYRLLVVAVCNSWHETMPFLFEKIADYTELLMPDDLLAGNSILAYTREAMTPDTCESVEVIGWLYQFYISEKKDSVMARKSAVPTEDIPAVTQLFTPHWIVRYLVENSLGRLWLLNNPSSKLREKMPYYIEGEAETDFLKIGKPEEIKVLDPACGSGHMLTYAFDLLYAIYEEQGYEAPSIPGLILKHNLYGVDICPRAAALAAFALVMKAREKSRRFFALDNRVLPNITELQDVKFTDGELHAYFKGIAPDRELTQMWPGLSQLCQQFEEAKNFGSLIQPSLSESDVQSLLTALQNSEFRIQNSADQLYLEKTHLKILRVLDQAEVLTQRYHVVVANPPYMGNGAMNPSLKQLVEQKYEPYKSDLFSVFIERGLLLTAPNGFAGFMSPFVWMFVSSFEDLRARLTGSATLTSLIQLEYSGFAGATVPICCFIALNGRSSSSKTAFIRLADFKGPALQEPKTLEAIRNKDCGWFYRVDPHKFEAIEGRPICFWAGDGVFDAFEKGRKLAEFAVTRKGMATGDNSRFVREWFEVNGISIGFKLDRTGAKHSGFRWFPYANGGAFRKWFGNDLEVVNWEDDGQLLQTERHHTGRIRAVNLNLDYIFLSGLSWTSITSSRQSYRLMPKGCLFSSAANSMFPQCEDTLWELLAFLNSDVAEHISKCLNPTLNSNPGDVSRLPLSRDCLGSSGARQTARDAIAFARADWDNFETSWDFHDLPLLRPNLKGTTLEASWQNWEAQSTTAIRRMQELETENNRLFINAYGLEGELQPEVPEDQITLARADQQKDMVAFISYAVGCMMGRYSLDKPGLILANAGDTLESYLQEVPSPSFMPDADGIIPVLDGEWFEDDIVARFRVFLRTTFGDLSFEQNLAFIEAALGKDLRSYFVKDFYKFHVQTYKKRPIYWMFSSAKGGFQALVYLHRYRPDTVSQLLNGYLRQFRTKLSLQQERLQSQSINPNLSAREKTAAIKELDKLKKLMAEVEAYERDIIFPLATQNLDIDLDDGVKVNYLKFGDALKTITGLAAKEDE